MHDPIRSFLSQRPMMVLDGALATELESRGANLRDSLWSARCLIERPELIRETHLDYFRAGADVATTATYQATFEGFARRGIERDDIALADFHRPRLRVLADAGADLLACETIPCLREARVLANLLREWPDTAAWISFSCRDGEHNCEGENMGACAAELHGHPQIVAVGVNCTAPQYITSLLRTMREATDKPLVIYPNSGECYDGAARQWSGESGAIQIGKQAGAWYAEGARLIGGCCRTGPRDIRAVKQCAHPAHLA